MRISRIALIASSVLCSLAAMNGAKAVTTATALMNNTATLAAYCSVSTGSLAFGTYNGSAALATSANIAVTCTKTTSYTVSLDAGTTTGGSLTTRKLIGSGTDTLNYTISQDSNHTTNFGTGVTGTGTGSAQTIVAYGNIAAGQFVTPDSYTDTVTVTLTY